MKRRAQSKGGPIRQSSRSSCLVLRIFHGTVRSNLKAPAVSAENLQVEVHARIAPRHVGVANQAIRSDAEAKFGGFAPLGW